MDSYKIAEVIPFRSFKEKLEIIKEEILKNKYIEVWDGLIYTAKKWEPKEKPLQVIDGAEYRSLIFGKCPRCYEEVFRDMNYCDKCGQALDWGVEDENI